MPNLYKFYLHTVLPSAAAAAAVALIPASLSYPYQDDHVRSGHFCFGRTRSGRYRTRSGYRCRCGRSRTYRNIA